MNDLDPHFQTVWPAPAKINLFLHIVGKRGDGYHELQTVFQFLDYGDELTFKVNHSGHIARDYDFGFSEETDLCLRAAGLLKPYAASNRGVTIGLTKNLPMGGGLGGGSSDAATVLLALNSLWDIGLPQHTLLELALSLGADVPVFIGGRSAWAEGIGERLTPVDPSEKWFLVANPNICVSTAAIFSNKQLTAGPQMMKIRAFQDSTQLHFGENQLEAIVRAEYPEVDSLFRWLEKFGYPRMTGSGGCVFLPLESQEEAAKVLALLPSVFSGFVAKGMNFHPLFEQNLLTSGKL